MARSRGFAFSAPKKIWVHWVLYNLPAKTQELSEGVPKKETLSSGAQQGKNDMKVGTVEKFRLPVLKPLGTGQGLALGTVAVRTRNGEISITCLWEVFPYGEWAG